MNPKKISLRLREKGCHPQVAEIVAQASVAYRKRQARKKAGKPLVLAIFWFLVGGLIFAKMTRPFHFVAWLLFMYAIYHGARALFIIVTGKESVKLK